MVKAALEEAEKAQNAAEKAIKQADEDIKGTQDLLTSVSSLWVFINIIERAPSLMLRNWCKMHLNCIVPAFTSTLEWVGQMLGDFLLQTRPLSNNNKKKTPKGFSHPISCPAKLTEQDCSPLNQQVWQDPWQATPVSHTGCVLVCSVLSTLQHQIKINKC